MIKADVSPLVKIVVVVAVAVVLFAVEQYRVAMLVDAAYTSGKTDAYTKVLSDTKKLSESLSESLGAEFDKHNAYIMQSINEERIQRNEVTKLLSTGVYVNGNCHEYAGISLLNDKIRSRYIQPDASASAK